VLSARAILLAVGIVLGLVPGEAFAERGAPRRPVLTNLQTAPALTPDLAEPGQPLEVARAAELRRIDADTERSLASLQGGAPCARIREGSRVPLRTQLFRDHERELSVGAALLLGAGLVAMLIRTSFARGVLALPPLLGAMYLGYAAYDRVDAERAVLRDGLRACTAELPRADALRPDRVAERRLRADALMGTIRRVAEGSGPPGAASE